MIELPKLTDPWLVSVWPGMGGVALKAGEYLAEQLGMEYVGDFPSHSYFEVNHLVVKGGVARPGDRPRCLVFVWKDPQQRHDLVLVLGESQPTVGAYELARNVVAWARSWGVVRVIGFAAMATQMHPSHAARTFGAATTDGLHSELKRLEVESLAEGQVTGLNGLVVAAAQEEGVDAACLLGELPYFATQVANPKASRAVLGVFSRMTGVDLDFTPLEQEAAEVDGHLIQLLERMQGETFEGGGETSGDPWLSNVAADEEAGGDGPTLDPDARERIERLFQEAKRDRSAAFELKKELDRLGVFDEYENRFLDLFKSDG